MQEARWYEKLEDRKVQCLLCPHLCMLNEGKTGICRVRKNAGGILFSENYGQLSALHLDPIEKKPLYHFFPGKQVFSIGSVGCNLHCNFCQNCDISQVSANEAGFLRFLPAEQVVSKALSARGSIGIAYTYNEPGIWIEYMEHTAILAKERGLKNIMVTNGFINAGPLREMTGYIDAFSVDLKAFNESFYRQQTSSSLEPVKKALEVIRASGRHLEVVNLVIPGLNDKPEDFSKMVSWIAGTLGKETILHLSAYYPRYRSMVPPTPVDTITSLCEIASASLEYVYAGNIASTYATTHCPACKKPLIRRLGYSIDIQGVSPDGSCKFCGKSVFENF
jgi:pyruvate formate lyase activating enzyme